MGRDTATLEFDSESISDADEDLKEFSRVLARNLSHSAWDAIERISRSGNTYYVHFGDKEDTGYLPNSMGSRYIQGMIHDGYHFTGTSTHYTEGNDVGRWSFMKAGEYDYDEPYCLDPIAEFSTEERIEEIGGEMHVV